jgi:hypothetical protein
LNNKQDIDTLAQMRKTNLARIHKTNLAMKKKLSMLSLLGAVAILIMGAVILSSCEGEQGLPGQPGQNGENGTNGTNGVDANSTCILCHSDDQVIVAKSKQYDISAHSTGHTSGYGNRTYGPDYNCAGCHTSQGFLDELVGASNTPYADITQPNCYTCHSIHDTYTEADWALTNGTTTAPYTGSTGVDLGAGNQCTQCHQFVSHYLDIDSLFVGFDAGIETVTIPADGSLKRVGVHHAPQYNIFVGMDLFEFTGSVTYPTSSHVMGKVEDGCVTCHMNDGFGDLTGHSMSMTYDFHGANYNWPASCGTAECHTAAGQGDPLDDKIVTLQAATKVQLDALEALLVGQGVMDEHYLAPGVWTTAQVAAVVNFNAIREDKSLGFHYQNYVEAILTNSIEAMTPAP